jgi:hypothetical protein
MHAASLLSAHGYPLRDIASEIFGMKMEPAPLNPVKQR